MLAFTGTILICEYSKPDLNMHHRQHVYLVPGKIGQRRLKEIFHDDLLLIPRSDIKVRFGALRKEVTNQNKRPRTMVAMKYILSSHTPLTPMMVDRKNGYD